MKRPLTKLELSISEILYKNDPVCVGSSINNPHKDEYDKEAVDIAVLLPGCKNVDDVQGAIYKVLSHWFSESAITSGRDGLLNSANEIYNLRNE